MTHPVKSTPRDPQEHHYRLSASRRNLALAAAILAALWTSLSGYLWSTGEASWRVFLAAVLIAVFTLIVVYSALTSSLTLSPEGIRYQAYGAIYSASWATVATLTKRPFLGRMLVGLSLTRPIRATTMSPVGRLLFPRPIRYIPLQDFESPEADWRADIEQYASNLLSQGTPPSHSAGRR